MDLDPQGNSTSGFGLDKNRRELCIYNALLGDTEIQEIIEPVEVENVFVVPATIQLAGAEIELVSAFSRETKLKTMLDSVSADFDYVIIDCPPSLGLLTVNALTAAEGLVIPIQCEYYALEGLSKLLDSVQAGEDPSESAAGSVRCCDDDVRFPNAAGSAGRGRGSGLLWRQGVRDASSLGR